MAGHGRRHDAIGNVAAFEADLRRREMAARGLEADLLTEVPMLYGSPNAQAPYGDPGIVLARLHHEAIIGRNGGGVPPGERSEPELFNRYERIAIAVILIGGIVWTFSANF